MLLYRPKQKISTTASEEVKFPASSIDGLATVATSGSYNDLIDKPEVPGVPDVVQTTGTSTTAVMSQKAVTDELDKKANRSGDTFTGDVIISSGKSLKTDIIKSADGTKWIAEIRGGGLEIGGTSAPLRLYSSTRPVHANVNKELAYTSDIPTNYVTTDTDWQEITSKKKFLRDQLIINNEIDIDASAPAPEVNQYRYIDFLGKNDKRIGIVGASIDTNKCYGAYLQAGNVTSMGVLSTPDGFGYSYGPIPPNKDNTNKLATTSWTGRRYKSISDFGFTSQTTVKAIVQKIIDNWYEYCTFACTNDNFNNFSDTPDGYGTLIIEVGSNALRPLISFTKQIGDSNSYKHWQANIVRGANNQVTEIQWYELALKTDIPTNYVTTDTTQAISGKKTVVTPPDTDDSTQIANTAWVRSHNQAIRGFDGVNYYTVNNVKTYYPADNYFLVAYTDHCINWQHVCAEMDVVDLDTRRAVYKLKVSGLLESAKSNNITTYTNKGNIGITDSFGERLNTGSTDINNDFFLVCRTTNKGRVRYEIWYNQRYAYNRHKFYFSVDEAHARTGVTQHFTWNKMRVDNAADVNYAKAGVTAYMDNKKVNPTYIPTSSWGVDVFKTTLSDDESYTNVTIFNNNLYSTTQVGVSTILNTVPYIDAKIQGYSGYKTIPSAQKTAEYRILSEDKGYLGGIRYDRDTNGYSSTRLSTCSTLSGANNAVALYASKGAADTKNTDANIWSFAPLTNNNINLGTDSKRWNNGYITNLQLCKVINGGGGNSMIQQNSDTNGADITVGSTGCPLKIQGKNARPTYRQGKNGTYANLALQSDIPIPFDSNDLSTGTYRSTNLPSDCSLVYIEDRSIRISGYFYQGSGQYGFQELYFITSYYTTSSGTTTLVIYKLRINGTQVEKTYKNLFVSSSGSVEVSEEYVENGTFYYKVLK